MAKSHSIAQAKYDKSHCKYYTLKMNLVNDADVIERLEQVKSKQGYIKQLIRDDIANTCSAPKPSMSLDDIYLFLEQYADNFGSMYDLLNALVGKHMGYTPDN